jgi:hypothetical protein
MSSKDVDSAIEVFISSMSGLGITLTEEEIDAKRRELEAIESGDNVLAVAGDDSGAMVETWEQVAQLPADTVVIVDDFVKLDDKSKLINVPFFARKWWFSDGDMGEFAAVQCVTQYPINTGSGETRKVIITDGSTGIFRQLRDVTKRTEGKTSSLLVRNGLRVSQYTVETDEGIKNAETYYLT